MTRRDRAREIAAGRPLLSADPFTVTWLSGLATDIEIGPSPFSVPPVVVLLPDGALLAVASEDEAGGVGEGVEVRSFPGFAVEEVDRPAESARLVLDAVAGARELAVELATLPGSVAAALRDTELVDVRPELQRARAVKDGDEVAALRAAIRVADAGQAAARSALAPGRSELELWTETRGAIERAAGSRVPVLADLVTGPRTAEVGGPPTGRVVGDPDLLLVDLVPRVGAYWADSCATVAVGERTAAVRQAHARARAALARGVEAIRPGLRCGELDGLCRAGLEYPHHTGHGIGVAFHEAPRVVPGSDVALEPGMVVALEPGVYGDGFGVRVEQVVLVTDDGCEVLSGHDLRL